MSANTQLKPAPFTLVRLAPAQPRNVEPKVPLQAKLYSGISAAGQITKLIPLAFMDGWKSI